MKMHLKIFNKNGTVVTNTRTVKKRRILYLIQADKTPNARFFIKVTYSKGFTNSGEYSSKQDVLLAFNAFMEK
jgi:hypothetical protein